MMMALHGSRFLSVQPRPLPTAETKLRGERPSMVHPPSHRFLILLRFNTRRVTTAAETSTSAQITTIHSHLTWLGPSTTTQQFLRAHPLVYNSVEARQVCAAAGLRRLARAVRQRRLQLQVMDTSACVLPSQQATLPTHPFCMTFRLLYTAMLQKTQVLRFTHLHQYLRISIHRCHQRLAGRRMAR